MQCVVQGSHCKLYKMFFTTFSVKKCILRNRLLASCIWGLVTAHGVGILMEMYVIYMETSASHNTLQLFNMRIPCGSHPEVNRCATLSFIAKMDLADF